MNVLDFFKLNFPKSRLLVNLNILEEMPLDSECGRVCAAAISQAAALDKLILEAHGDYYKDYTHQTYGIASVAASLCVLYIRG